MTTESHSLIIIFNRHAGRDRPKPLTGKTLQKRCDQIGLEADVREIDGTSLIDTIEAAVADEPEVLVAAGGDGTVSAVATRLVDSHTVLGVLPLGTLNHFARDCGIPNELEPALDLLKQGPTRPVDVGEVNDHIFINNASIGIYPKTVRLRDGLSSRLGGNKWLAMFIAGLRMLGRFPTYRVKVKANGEAIEVETPLVFVGNNEYSVDIFDLGSRQTLSDGCLHLLTADSAGRVRMGGLAIRSLFGPPRKDTVIHHRLAPELTLTTRRERVRVALDGEVFQMTAPLTFSSRAGALTVIRPEETGDA